MKSLFLAGLLALGVCAPTHPVMPHHIAKSTEELPDPFPINRTYTFSCETLDSMIYEWTNIEDRLSRKDCIPVQNWMPIAVLTPEIWVNIKNSHGDDTYLFGTFDIVRQDGSFKTYYTAIDKLPRDEQT